MSFYESLCLFWSGVCMASALSQFPDSPFGMVCSLIGSFFALKAAQLRAPEPTR